MLLGMGVLFGTTLPIAARAVRLILPILGNSRSSLANTERQIFIWSAWLT